MKIRNRLTLLFTAIIATLLLVFALTVYLSYSKNREEEYYKELYKSATTKASLLLDAKIAPAVLQLIYKNSSDELYPEEVAIYDTHFKLLYHDAVSIDKVKETRAMIDEIIARKRITFNQGELQVIGFLYPHQGKFYVITAAAKDVYGLNNAEVLKYTLFAGFLIAIVLVFIFGNFFAKQALKPVSDLVGKVAEINAKSLDSRVTEGNGKDEIAELAITFNQMLDRLENSFDAQKQFVSSIAHELRTPLAAMLGELELSLQKERSTTDYKQAISHAIEDGRQLAKLSSNLLDFAKASYDPSKISFKELRLDEILMDARSQLLHRSPGYQVNLIFEKEIEDDDFISIQGNEYLLNTAFINLMENGCKFSADKACQVAITYYADKVIIRFQDNGIGISAEELPHIFKPFYRAENSQYAGGSGIGLSLTKKIVTLHKGEIWVSSAKNEGAVFTVEFPHV
ncbi:HAMP domain-containing sensor histidine kinase [Pedobacter foliorum]|uniref:HAMP domain-containing sensor histidine kinase n=1 Tax=Pedobacter foliorum TaxID=2739058 RepID=UPI001563104B|nr:HAMP domain-containing sensor histidine kinase [Pedobacter foliorum]NRF39456.1 HAMP domain-containing histidine kinase [Pedobacter foliorum]